MEMPQIEHPKNYLLPPRVITSYSIFGYNILYITVHKFSNDEIHMCKFIKADSILFLRIFSV